MSTIEDTEVVDEDIICPYCLGDNISEYEYRCCDCGTSF